MLNTSSHTLKILASLVWYIGVVVLSFKSAGLFLAADRGGASSLYIILAVLVGLMIGWVKAKYLFIKMCDRNLKRINTLKKPVLWQFYRFRFFIFLGLMVSLGAYLSTLVQGNYLMLTALAIVELSIATALL